MKENGCIPRDRIKLKTELRLRLDKDFWGRQKGARNWRSQRIYRIWKLLPLSVPV